MSTVPSSLAAIEPRQLYDRLDQLGSINAQHFDPLRFRFIEALARRSFGQAPLVVQGLLNKAEQALQQYQADFEVARQQAEARCAAIAEDYPDHKKPAEALLQRCAFAELARLQHRLAATNGSGRRALLALQQSLAGSSGNAAGTASSFVDSLREQESDIRSTYGSAIDSSGAGLTLNKAVDAEMAQLARPMNELESVRRYRESWVRINSDKLVTRAVEEGFDDPGPLNQEMLATRSLSIMREISPAYVNHFVSYVETLLWLEKAATQAASSRKSRAGKKRRSKKADNSDS